MSTKLKWIEIWGVCLGWSFVLSRVGITVSATSAKAVLVSSNILSVHPFLFICCTSCTLKICFQNMLENCSSVIYFLNCCFSVTLLRSFFLIPSIFIFFLCLSLKFDCFLHFPVYLHWPFPRVATCIAWILARGVVEFIFEQFQFPFCSFPAIALSLFVFLSHFFYLYPMCCAEIQHLHLSPF